MILLDCRLRSKMFDNVCPKTEMATLEPWMYHDRVFILLILSPNEFPQTFNNFIDPWRIEDQADRAPQPHCDSRV